MHARRAILPKFPTAYRNHRIFSTVAPSSGSVVLAALKIFEGFPGDVSDADPAINVTTHRLIQATRFGYAERFVFFLLQYLSVTRILRRYLFCSTNFGDPAFTANVSSLEA
jgi:gamma-glutamyltranspeptidase/glutathione hydrolase